MPILTEHPPLSLYIHLPWCIKKCPYCDFNSHAVKNALPEKQYVAKLVEEFSYYSDRVGSRSILSIFFGGGTPSLFSGQAIGDILVAADKALCIDEKCEITLEANPGTVDYPRFKDFRQAGINRLSLGIQSFQDDKLKSLGRIHDSGAAKKAIDTVVDAGFDNFNLDLMYGLPSQQLEDCLFDLEQAIAFQPSHLSWYQLTIEPNTLFYHQKPSLPNDEALWQMQMAGQTLLGSSAYQQYEVSAYAKTHWQCLHNLNYWQYGDYIGVGAGAHGKLTDKHTGKMSRTLQMKHPQTYLNQILQVDFKTIDEAALPFEFMLNALRLNDGFNVQLFESRTGLRFETIVPIIETAKNKGLLAQDQDRYFASALGRRFLNDLTMMFLDNG